MEKILYWWHFPQNQTKNWNSVGFFRVMYLNRMRCSIKAQKYKTWYKAHEVDENCLLKIVCWKLLLIFIFLFCLEYFSLFISQKSTNNTSKKTRRDERTTKTLFHDNYCCGNIRHLLWHKHISTRAKNESPENNEKNPF